MKDLQYYVNLIGDFAINYGIKIVLALIIFIIGRRLARWITDMVISTMQKEEVDRELVGFVESLLYFGLLAIVLIAVLAQLGVQTASFIAVLGAASLAIGLALQGSLSNFAAGMLILLLRPFRVDEYVEMAGVSGIVNKIRVFTTELRTPDNKCVIIPNARVLEDNIINYSSTGMRRVDLMVGIGYDDDLDKAKSIIRGILKDEPKISNLIEPQVEVMTLGQSSIDIVVRPWAKTDNYWDVHFNVTTEIKKQFDEHGITIPFPQQVVHHVNAPANPPADQSE